MNANINKVILIGRLGGDPETKAFENTSITKFSLATEESWTDKGSNEKKSKTTWHNIQAWNGRGETMAKYLKKGSPVYIEGKLVNDQWEDKEGNKRTTTNVEVTGFQFLDSRPAE